MKAHLVLLLSQLVAFEIHQMLWETSANFLPVTGDPKQCKRFSASVRQLGRRIYGRTNSHLCISQKLKQSLSLSHSAAVGRISVMECARALRICSHLDQQHDGQ
jgi:hypothetical protein